MSTVRFLTVDQLTIHRDAIMEGRCVLLDVREKKEYDTGHIPMAISKPLSQMELWIDDLDKNVALIAYCRIGRRSHHAAKRLIHHGYPVVYSLEGGINAWNRSRSRT
jgi:rhodanese-related sulfurtransferase